MVARTSAVFTEHQSGPVVTRGHHYLFPKSVDNFSVLHWVSVAQEWMIKLKRFFENTLEIYICNVRCCRNQVLTVDRSCIQSNGVSKIFSFSCFSMYKALMVARNFVHISVLFKTRYREMGLRQISLTREPFTYSTIQ